MAQNLARVRKNLIPLPLAALVLAVIPGHVTSAPDDKGFDGERAWQDVWLQSEAFGARIPGLPGHQTCREWIKDEIVKAGRYVKENAFPAKLELIQKHVTGYNIWGLPYPPEEMKEHGPYYVLSAHWDTRPYPDLDEDGGKGKMLAGANDGGSGVAMALGIARAIRGTPLEKRVVIVFFDAEDSGVGQKEETWCIGSRYEAKNPPDWLREKLIYGINLDMVGANRLELRPEGFSVKAEPELVRRLWHFGAAQATRIFYFNELDGIVDDHKPFLDEGFRWINLIGIPYLEWHKSGDNISRISGPNMKTLADTLIMFLEKELAAGGEDKSAGADGK